MLSLSHLVDFAPMDNKVMQFMEVINDIFVLITSQMLFLFTDLIPDVENRYFIGTIYKNILFFTISVNGLLVFAMIGYSVWQKVKLNKLKKAMLVNWKNKLVEKIKIRNRIEKKRLEKERQIER